MLKSAFALARAVTSRPKLFVVPMMRFSRLSAEKISTIEPLYSNLAEEDFEDTSARFANNISYLDLVVQSLNHTFKERSLAYAITLARMQAQKSNSEKEVATHTDDIIKLIDKNLESIQKPNTLALIYRSSIIFEKLDQALYDRLLKHTINIFTTNYEMKESGNLLASLIFTFYKRNIEYPPELIDFLIKNHLKLAVVHTINLTLYFSLRVVQNPALYEKLLENLRIAHLMLMSDELLMLLYLWNVGKIGGESVMHAKTLDQIAELIERASKNIQTRGDITSAAYASANNLLAIAKAVDSSALSGAEAKIKGLESKVTQTTDKKQDFTKMYLEAIDSLIESKGDQELKKRIEQLKQ